MILESEKILDDDYPVYGNYLYVCDGKVIMCDLLSGTVADFKRDIKQHTGIAIKEVRNCDIAARRKL